jgi:hypothetical protein
MTLIDVPPVKHLLRRTRSLLLGASLLAGGCATPYTYAVHLDPPEGAAANAAGPDVVEDADIRAEVLADPTGLGAVSLALTNKSNQKLQIKWSQIVLVRSNGDTTSPRPDSDLGWIEPGAKVSARLIPFALPRSGSAAEAYQGAKFELDVPMIVKRETKIYRFHLTAHVQKA